MKAVLTLPFLIAAVVLVVSLAEQPGTGATSSLAVIGIGIILWSVMPRRYVVMDDRLRIALGGPLGISVPYSRLRGVKTSGNTLSMNFVTSVSTGRVLYIMRRGAMSIAITPTDRETFIEKLNAALASYQRTAGNLPGT